MRADYFAESDKADTWLREHDPKSPRPSDKMPSIDTYGLVPPWGRAGRRRGPPPEESDADTTEAKDAGSEGRL